MDKRTLPNEVLLGEVAAVLRDGREAVIIPSGNSMLPFIRGGVDRVAIRRQADVAVGDIVLVQAGERYLLHRVVAREGFGAGDDLGDELGCLFERCCASAAAYGLVEARHEGGDEGDAAAEGKRQALDGHAHVAQRSEGCNREGHEVFGVDDVGEGDACGGDGHEARHHDA